ncbi:MAG: glucose-6-phosphate dehydrogenase, partial [Solirubrobacteraceae bacterium]
MLFGATGDLAKRKLLPGLHHLFRAGLLPEHFRIIGSAPPEFAVSDDEFRSEAEAACRQFGNCAPDGSWDKFAARLSFGAASPEDPSALVSAVDAADKAIAAESGGKKNGNGGGHGTPDRLFHLAVPPSAFESVVRMLGASGLANATAR